MKEIISLLINQQKKISVMESCTGGGIANAITNIEGSSEVFEFGAVTYSNEYKIKMGVNSEIIKKYSVYSMETAHEMSKSISEFTGSDYGIGVTGKINKNDPNNPYGEDNIIYVSIFDKERCTYHEKIVKAIYEKREKNKELIIDTIIKILLEVLK